MSGGENSLLDRIDELDTYNQRLALETAGWFHASACTYLYRERERVTITMITLIIIIIRK